MPLYEYQCDACGKRFEVIQKSFSDPPPEVCKVCGKGPVQRLMSSPAIQFKGSGFYITDYAKKGSSDAGSGSAKGGDSKSESGGSGEATKSEPAAKPESSKSDSGSSTSAGSSSASSSTSTPAGKPTTAAKE